MSLLQDIQPRKQRGSNASGLLSSRKAIYQRNQDKTLAVLRFLRTTIYSTSDILGQVMGVNAKSTISMTLQSMEAKHLLRRKLVQEKSRRFIIWGITPTGQDAALQHGEDPVNVFFNIAKIRFRGLDHYLSLQQIRARAERENWREFIYCDRRALDKTKPDTTIKEKIRPDLIARDPSGRLAAIESELTLKRPTLYREHVIPGHVRRINAEEYDYVVWICSDANDEKTLRGFLTGAIQELTKEEALHLDRTVPGIKPFYVTSIESWPKF
jgi:DNA-binding MarR family transcriptional regulator